MIVLGILWLAVALVAGWRAWRRLRFFLHIFQLEGYQADGFVSWLSRRIVPLGVAPSHPAGLGLIALVAATGRWWAVALALLGWLIAFASDAAYAARAKKPLVFTSRMTRLATAAAVLALLPAAGGAIAGIGAGAAAGTAIYLAGWLLADLGAPVWVMLSALVMKPIENAVQGRFKADARAKLSRQTELTVVGITGSYGKTSTKFATAEILRQRFNTLATPGSYNTPMGLCLVINNQLRPDHRVLVLEYGIRHPGDMDDLTDLARPSVAMVTSIGIAHLESMGSIDSIVHEKGRLVEALQPGGVAILNVDDARVASMADRVPGGASVIRVSTRGAPGADLMASDIRYDRRGATFSVTDGSGEREHFTTRLLGNHNVANVLMGLAAGKWMGLRLRQMVPAVERIRPVEHRLELKDDAGVTVIDDAFNSNPVGARNAVEVLARFEGGRRAIVTPGMIELGPRQHEENKTFGRHIAEHLTGEADLAVLVGPRQTAPIQEGLAEAGYPPERLRVVASLYEARELLRSELRPGDVVLYENDLPDQYNEETRETRRKEVMNDE